MIYGVELKVRKSVIIFDEVQKCPNARQAIKYLVKDHRYDYIETGSLISIRKNIEKILFPSEELEINMYPMDYEEFKWALGDSVSIPLLAQCFNERKSLGDTPTVHLCVISVYICLSVECRKPLPHILKLTIWQRWTEQNVL